MSKRRPNPAMLMAMIAAGNLPISELSRQGHHWAAPMAPRGDGGGRKKKRAKLFARVHGRRMRRGR